MSEAKVVSIGGVHVAGEPCQIVVEALESLLEKALRGELIGIAYVTADGARNVGTGWAKASGLGIGHLLTAGLAICQHRMVQSVREDIK